MGVLMGCVDSYSIVWGGDRGGEGKGRGGIRGE